MPVEQQREHMETIMEQLRAAASGKAEPVITRPRLDSIDLLRGLVMVIMALDHVRDYFSNALLVDPVNLNQTTAPLFLTRWITHFCAPTFVFLSGTGAFLYGLRGRSRGELSWFLFSRGLWLVFLEITVVRFAWNFNLAYRLDFGGGVIHAIGWSMVGMAALIWLPVSTIAVFGLGMVCFHNLLDDKPASFVHLPEWLWIVLHQGGGFPIRDMFPDWGWVQALLGRTGLEGLLAGQGLAPDGGALPLSFGTGYCILPWLGVMACGYAFGTIYLLEPQRRKKQLLGLGLGLIAAFIALRLTNLYGDREFPPGTPDYTLGKNPGPWVKQDSFLFTIFSFVNCQKYPPSLLYLLVTLGPAITALALFERRPGPLGRFFVVYGRVPLFYYLLHLFLIHGLMVGLDYWRFGYSPYRNLSFGLLSQQYKKSLEPGNPPFLPPGYGYSLPIVYLVWIGLVLFLFPLCYWYAGVKRRSKSAWLSYL
jgi:uncharacterized membrane protein